MGRAMSKKNIEKAKIYAEYYASGMSKSEALRKAGYYVNMATADRLLTYPVVKEHYDNCIKKNKEKIEIETNEIIKNLVNIALTGESEASRVSASKILLDVAGVIGTKRELPDTDGYIFELEEVSQKQIKKRKNNNETKSAEKPAEKPVFENKGIENKVIENKVENNGETDKTTTIT